MTKNGIRYGEVFTAERIERLGILSAIANVFWKTGLGNEEESEAGLLLMRRSFGFGRTNIILRTDAWKVREPLLLQQMAENAAKQLLSGTASVHEVNLIADMIVNSIDALLAHPPESEAVQRKRKMAEMERDGLFIRSNGKILVDAR